MTNLTLSDIDLQGVRLVVFDLDGTLYDKHGLAWRLMLSQWRNLLTLKAERSVRKRLRGVFVGDETLFYQTLFDAIAHECNLSHRQVSVWYRESYMPAMVKILRQSYEAAPFVRELLLQLKHSGVRVVVFSDYGEVPAKLEAIGLSAKMFDGVFDAPALGGLKPCKEAFLSLLRQMNTQPHEALMIGDREDTDGEGARCVGMRFLHV
ncbi:MAG: HAD family hydrolase [Paludibacter sp.]|nr:HAD family hydrolase [Bacteroidales bacterium]MCM1069092.1 HAD family hydrolase [Prevotella sp.]MCM1353531.1 HAD family hydrolase [Bacteroides sp.]MCM1442692.1 HAD family hydrolase [Muribaculum sp.]MCM1481672.1 HAD family hydrolase [Paludibacter sp.]